MGSIPIVASLFSPFLLTSQTCIEKWSVSFQSTGSWVILNKDVSTSLSSDPLSAGLFECEGFFLEKVDQGYLVFDSPEIGWVKSNYLRFFSVLICHFSLIYLTFSQHVNPLRPTLTKWRPSVQTWIETLVRRLFPGPEFNFFHELFLYFSKNTI